MLRINLINNEISRVPLPPFLSGLTVISLQNLSWTDPSLGVSQYGWWPEDIQLQPIDDGLQKYGNEIYVVDNANKKVVVSREVLQLTPQESAEKLRAAIDAKIFDIDKLAKLKRDYIVRDYSPGEMASWPIKRAEALAYQSAAAATDADAPALAAEALVRGIATANLVAKVASNSALLTNLEAQIAGTAGKHRDAVAAMTTTQSVRGYDITTGWPV